MENIRKVNVAYKRSWNKETLVTHYEKNLSKDDEFVVYSCSDDSQCYTDGLPRTLSINLNTDIASADRIINGLPVYQMQRTGQISYHGPGILAVVAHLNISQHDLHKALTAILKSTVDYVLDKHGLQLYFNEDDPGFYDSNGAKIISFDYGIGKPRILFYVSINVLVSDFNYLTNTAICGINNRSVANLLKTGTSIPHEQLDLIAQDLLTYIWKNLYPDQNVTIE
jgi:lipoate-protein ligase B